MKSQRLFTVGVAALLAISSAQAAVEVSSKPTHNMSCTGGVCSATAKNAIMNVDDLVGMLSTGDVTIESGASAQDIEINAAISWASADRLTLDAFRSLAFDKPVVVGGSGGLTLTTDDGGANGDYRFFKAGRITFRHLQSNLVINGNSYVLVSNLNAFAHLLREQGSDGKYFALAKHVDLTGKVYPGAAIRPFFVGTFEGLGNTVSHLTIEAGKSRSLGLFSELGDRLNPVIRDLVVSDVSISGTGENQLIGGVVGYVSAPGASVLNCSVSGELSGGNDSRVGGVVGANDGSVRSSHSTATVTGTEGSTAAGGLVGQSNGAVTGSYATGQVVGTDGVMAGGLVGLNLAASISNSYATGSVTGTGSADVGGLVGMSDQDLPKLPAIADSYSTGSVSGGTAGGFVGDDAYAFNNANDYWDLDTSGIGDPSQGAGNVANDFGITGLTDGQLKSGLPAGFDSAIWGQSASINDGYPYLIANPPQ